MENIIRERIKEWSNPPFDDATINEIKKLVQSNNEKELTDRFYTSLEFGTGGLRGIIGAGTNRMNIYTVGMAAQGLANYILKKGGKDRGVVIAFDSRKMSDTFTGEAASILAGNGIKVYIFDDITPTPLCSFAIRELKAQSGIVITASHNPPEYNGFKAYWEDGGQVIPPVDMEIINEVKNIKSIEQIIKIPREEGERKGLIKKIGSEIRKKYIEMLETRALRERKPSKIKIAYSPLHGTGYKIVPRVLGHFGFTEVSVVESQAKPDGSFPTVKYPNPEEKEAMGQVIELGQQIGAHIIMATDPDADRMGVGFRGDNGEFILINGNQIGTMLEYYLLKRLNGEKRIPEKGAVIKTIVTTELQTLIAEKFSCRMDNVLTGFKWIAQKMEQYRESGTSFIFGGEESYGYLPVDFVRDKDAVSSCYFFAEMADYLLEQNRSLNDFLNEIYLTFGLYAEGLHSLTLKGQEGMGKIQKIMEFFRENPPEEFNNTKITKLIDVQRQKVFDRENGSSEDLKDLPKSNVLQFILQDNTKITMRPSGTEPKIKFYFSVNEKVSKDSIESSRQKLKDRIESFKRDLLDKVDTI